MGFLAALAADLVKWGIEKLSAWAVKTWHMLSRRKEIQKQSEDSVKPLKDATTGDEIDKATDSTLGGL